MRSGDLDRKIIIQKTVETRGSAGEEVILWIDFADVWASKKDVSGLETFTQGKPQGFSNTVFKIRYLKGLTNKMRIVFDGINYDIESIKELGRREGHEITSIALVE